MEGERGANGEQTFARSAPRHIDSRVLAANVAESHTVPAGAKFVLFSSDGDFYARPDATAAIPADDVTDGSGSEINPVAWDLTGVSAIGLIASATRIVTLSFYTDSGQ